MRQIKCGLSLSRCLPEGGPNHQPRYAVVPRNATVPNSMRSRSSPINRSKPIFKTKPTMDDQERPRTNTFRNAPLGTVAVTPDRPAPSRVHVRSGALWALSPDGLHARSCAATAPRIQRKSKIRIMIMSTITTRITSRSKERNRESPTCLPSSQYHDSVRSPAAIALGDRIVLLIVTPARNRSPSPPPNRLNRQIHSRSLCCFVPWLANNGAPPAIWPARSRSRLPAPRT
jgi:hypothetical protein